MSKQHICLCDICIERLSYTGLLLFDPLAPPFKCGTCVAQQVVFVYCNVLQCVTVCYSLLQCGMCAAQRFLCVCVYVCVRDWYAPTHIRASLTLVFDRATYPPPHPLTSSPPHMDILSLCLSLFRFLSRSFRQALAPASSSGSYAHTHAHHHTHTITTWSDRARRASPTAYTLKHITTHCNTLQHTATHCNILQHNTQQHTIANGIHTTLF